MNRKQDPNDKIYSLIGVRLEGPDGSIYEPKTFGALVRVARVMLRDMSIAELVRKSGVKRTTIIMLEAGKDARLSTTGRLLAALDISLEGHDLMKEAGDAKE